MTSGIYSITNIKNKKRYIGSAVNIKKRWDRHRVDLRGGKHHSRHLQAAWNKYGEKAFRFEIITTCEPEDLIAQEQFWIDAFQAADFRYGYNRAPIANSQLGVKRSPETLAKMSLASKGRAPSPETRAKLSAASKEMHQRPDIKAKIIAALTGRKLSPESRAKIATAARGRHPDPEARAKMSASAKRRRATPEARANMRAAQLGQNGANAKLTDDDVCRIRRLLADGMKQEDIARKFGVSQTCISHIKLGKNWGHVK